MRCIVSCVQPSGALHLGNYLGALREFVTLQKNASCFFGIVDLHALTTAPDPEVLRENVYHTAAAFLAAGVDAQNIFVQSRVPAHTELAWILSCTARMGWLERMTQFKEKAQNRERASVGLFAYPILMAADILLYRATHVPVGEDQKQHLELARDVAHKFNTHYGETFPLPEPLIPEGIGRVMSLRDGTRKMSKSGAAAGCLFLTDDPKTLARKVRHAKTDSEPLPHHTEALASRLEAQNLVNLTAALSGKTPQEVLGHFGGGGFAPLKAALTEALVAQVAPVGKKLETFLADRDHLEALLESGTQRACAAAEGVLQTVRRRTGLHAS